MSKFVVAQYSVFIDHLLYVFSQFALSSFSWVFVCLRRSDTQQKLLFVLSTMSNQIFSQPETSKST